MLEVAADLAVERDGRALITLEQVREVATGGRRRFDKGGEQFYDQISALHKAVRGTDPDGALYWFARMLDGGCDPHYLARRIVRYGRGRHRAGGSARSATRARRLADFRATRQSRRRARARERRRVPGRGAEEQCGLRGVWRSEGGRRGVRHARRAAALPQCTDETHERPGLRRGIPVRARRSGRLREGPNAICPTSFRTAATIGRRRAASRSRLGEALARLRADEDKTRLRGEEKK
jgi:hypothetical protein